MNTITSATNKALITPAADPIGPLKTPIKAQKVRRKAQSERDFKHDLRQTTQREAGNKPPATEQAKTQSKDTTKTKGSTPQDGQSRQTANSEAGVGHLGTTHTGVGRETPTDGQPRGQASHSSDPAANTPPDQAFIERIVAQVMQGVDPASRLTLTGTARTRSTVAGQTAQEMRRAPGVLNQPAEPRQTETSEPAQQAEPSGEGLLALPEGFTQVQNPQEPQTQQAQPPIPAEAQAHESTPSQPHTHPAPAAVLASIEKSFAALDTQPAITVAPVVATATRAAANAKLSEQSSTTKSLAQQVQQGLEVAMHDLPTPAGERLVTLRLHPSALGSLRIAMQVKGDAVAVRFQVGSPKARGAIDASIGDLRAAIARQGLRIESLEVEEDRALAADADNTIPDSMHQQGAVPTGKPFASLIHAPRGSDDPQEPDGPGRTPTTPDPDHEGGVLQVLTFRLNAVG